MRCLRLLETPGPFRPLCGACCRSSPSPSGAARATRSPGVPPRLTPPPPCSAGGGEEGGAGRHLPQAGAHQDRCQERLSAERQGPGGEPVLEVWRPGGQQGIPCRLLSMCRLWRCAGAPSRGAVPCAAPLQPLLTCGATLPLISLPLRCAHPAAGVALHHAPQPPVLECSPRQAVSAAQRPGCPAAAAVNAHLLPCPACLSVPACRYNELDCRAASHTKWGCPEGMDAARQKAKATAAKVKATLGSREDDRRWGWLAGGAEPIRLLTRSLVFDCSVKLQVVHVACSADCACLPAGEGAGRRWRGH